MDRLDIPTVISPNVFEDERGFFLESYNIETFISLGIYDNFIQDNHSKSSFNMLRGLHYQLRRPQSKLLRAIKGTIFDVAVDIRPESENYKEVYTAILSEENKNMFYVPRGFAHGFYVMSPTAEITYKCDNLYDSEDQRGIYFDDKSLGIDWPFSGSPLTSEQDDTWPYLNDIAIWDLPK